MSKHGKIHWGMQALSGGQISAQDAKQLEKTLASDAFDYSARATLLGYYASGRARSKAAIKNRHRHILWVIEHVPECDLGRTPYLHIARTEYPEAYNEAKRLLLLQCEKFKKNADILTDLGCVLGYEEPEIAEPLLRQALAISEQKNRVRFWLASILHRSGKEQKDRNKLVEAVSLMKKVVRQREPSRRFDYRFWLAKMALDSQQIDLARRVSEEMLNDDSGNFQSVHVAHIVLGSIALQNGNMISAIDHLCLAARVGRSPRLSSYGPMMSLAQALLEEGEREAVIDYLNHCKKFWRSGTKRLTNWVGEIETGRSPILEGDDW